MIVSRVYRVKANVRCIYFTDKDLVQVLNVFMINSLYTCQHCFFLTLNLNILIDKQVDRMMYTEAPNHQIDIKTEYGHLRGEHFENYAQNTLIMNAQIRPYSVSKLQGPLRIKFKHIRCCVSQNCHMNKL